MAEGEKLLLSISGDRLTYPFEKVMEKDTEVFGESLICETDSITNLKP
ncbi:hypothetical protein [Okeania sp. SIO2B3]|nr:hypothetical protein [Okeania sp. SIO2B3]NET43837.1 hypothetical protein [Okeania sp. SIO2B3]